MAAMFIDCCLYVGSIVKNKWFLVSRKVLKKLKLYKKKQQTRRYGRSLLSLDNIQECIIQKIMSGQPFMAARIGGVEGKACLADIGVKLKMKKKIPTKSIEKLCLNAGFFPAEEKAVMEFSSLMLDKLKSIDFLGSMKLNPEEYLVRKYIPKHACLTEIGNLEPYYADNPWTQALQGKKVLVIHPFVDTIVKQYEKRSLLFEDKRILPEFDLKTLKAVQSIAGTQTEYNDWFDALNWMYQKAMEIDFDIALIGCGAYGLPLAAKIKESGKQAIHLGGAVQILFGIKGERWNSVPEVRKLFNEHWVHPATDEIPEKAELVEGGCYW